MSDIRVYLFEDDNNTLHAIPNDTNFNIEKMSLCGILKSKLINYNLPGDPPLRSQSLSTLYIPKPYKKCPVCFEDIQ